jgi:UDP-glucose:(heptosyl)LPS alpha-1,3-glucosyltransferase
VHHISTFHGQPFATIFERSWLRLISLRVAMHLFLERRELSVPKLVVPNSELTRRQLLAYYPQFKDRIGNPVPPGVACNVVRQQRLVEESAGVIAFVGTEWRRKGLAFAAKIVEQLRKKRPLLTFVVVGPSPGSVAHLFSGWDGGYKLVGWMDKPSYSYFDVLLHPATVEPYGMVVTEALCANLQVVISDRCGVAAEVASENGSVLPLNNSIEDWVDALEIALKKSNAKAAAVRSWETAALEYQSAYAEIIHCQNRDRFSNSSSPVFFPDDSDVSPGLRP